MEVSSQKQLMILETLHNSHLLMNEKKTIQVKKDLWRSRGSTSCFKEGSELYQAAQGLIQPRFTSLQGWRFPRRPVTVTDHPHTKKLPAHGKSKHKAVYYGDCQHKRLELA